MFRAKMMMIQRYNTFTTPTRLQWQSEYFSIAHRDVIEIMLHNFRIKIDITILNGDF